MAANHMISGNNVPFRKPADRRVARHLSNRIQVLGKQKRLAAEPGSGGARLNPGVSGADHDYIKCLRVAPHKRRKDVILLPNGTNAKGRSHSGTEISRLPLAGLPSFLKGPF